MTRLLPALVVGALLGLAAPASAAPAVAGETAEDREMARDLRRYFARNFAETGWYDTIRLYRVRAGVITIRTALRPPGRRASRRICLGIQGADVADFTPGHRVLGRRGVVLRRCRHRQS